MGSGEPQSRLSTRSDKYSFLPSAFWDGYLCVSTLRVAIQFFRQLRLLFCRSECLRRPGTAPASAELYRYYPPSTGCNSPLGRSNNSAWPPRRVARTPQKKSWRARDYWKVTFHTSQRPDTRFAPPHMHTVIRKTARSLAYLLRNFGPFLPPLIVLFPFLPVIPPGLHPSCQMFQLPPIVVRLSGNICSRSEESPPGARSSLVIGDTPIIAIGHPDNRRLRSSKPENHHLLRGTTITRGRVRFPILYTTL